MMKDCSQQELFTVKKVSDPTDGGNVRTRIEETLAVAAVSGACRDAVARYVDRLARGVLTA